MGGLSTAGRWVDTSLRIGAVALLVVAFGFLTPSTASAACRFLPTPQSIADAMHSPDGGLVFEGVVRQHWFKSYLIEVQRTWEGQTPTRFVTVGPCNSEECGIRDLAVGRSYVFWVGLQRGPIYETGCDEPFDPDPRLIQLLGAGAAAPSAGPMDLLAVGGFVWSSASGVVLVVAAIVVVAVVIRLSRKFSTG